MAKGLSKSLVSLAMDCISGVMAHAMDEEWVAVNRTAVNRLDETLSGNFGSKTAEQKYGRIDLPNPHPSAPQAHPAEMKKAQPLEIAPLPKTWCRRGDSNPYVGTHTRP